MEALREMLKIDFGLTPDSVTRAYLRTIYYTTHHVGLSWIGVEVGRHRAGKSLGTIAVATMLDRTFWDDLEMRVVYYAKDFMRALRKIRKQEIIGAHVVWDEAGVGLPARQWYDLSNQAISSALQVAGYLRPALHFVTQDFTYIDSQARKLVQHFWEFRRSSTEKTTIIPSLLAHNRRSGDVYFYYPRIIYRYPDGSLGPKVIINRIYLYRPPRELEERYIIHSHPWKDKILKQAEEKAKEYMEGDLEKKEWTVNQIIDYLSKHWKAYQTPRSRPDRPILDPYLIKYDFNIPINLARVVKARVENILRDEIKKGIPPKEVKTAYDKK